MFSRYIVSVLCAYTVCAYGEENRAPRPEPLLPIAEPAVTSSAQAACDFIVPCDLYVDGTIYAGGIPLSDAFLRIGGNTTTATLSYGTLSPFDVRLLVNGSERLRFEEATGKVFIQGVASNPVAGSVLSINGMTGELGVNPFVGSGDINNGGNAFGADISIGTNDPFDLMFITNGVARTNIDANGNFSVDTNVLYVDALNNRVGINNAAPAVALDVTGSANVTAAAVVGTTLGVTGLSTLTGGLTVPIGGVTTLAGAVSQPVSATVRVATISNTGVVGFDATLPNLTDVILQNGNSFGVAMTIGTNDNQSLNFETNGLTRATFSNTGNFAVDTNTLFVDATNNRVGVNNAAPAVALDVTGSANVTAAAAVGTTLGVTGLSTLTGGLTVPIGGVTTLAGAVSQPVSATVRVATISNTGVVGFDATLPNLTDVILQNGNSFGVAMTIGTNDNQSLNFETNGLTRATFSNTGNFAVDTNTLFVDATNNRVGVNNAAPAVALDVTGSANVTAAAAVGTTLGVTGLSTLTGGLTVPIGGVTTLAGAVSQPVSGTVRIATISNTGVIGFDGTLTNLADVVLQNGNSFGAAMTIGTNDAQALNFETSGTTRATFSSAGNFAVDTNVLFVDAGNNRVGINNATPGFDLDVNGNINMPNSTSATGVLYKASSRFLHNVGTSTVYLGVNAGTLTTTAQNSVGIGTSALTAVTSGQNHVAIGSSAAAAVTNQGNIVAIGTNAYSVGTASNNLVIGHSAGTALLTGTPNTIIGNSAGASITTGVSNVMVGSSAGAAVGVGSGANVFVGASAAAGFSATNTNNVVAIGSGAYFNTGGSTDIAIGNNALGTGTKSAGPNYNIAIGVNAGYSVSSGTRNVIIGSYISNLPTLSTGSNNIIIGADAAAFSNASNNVLMSQTLLSASAFTGGSNVIIGSPTINATFNPNRAILIGNGNLSSLVNPSNEAPPIVISATYNLSMTDGRGNIIIGNSTSGTTPNLADGRKITIIGTDNAGTFTTASDVILLGNNLTFNPAVGSSSTYIANIFGKITSGGSQVFVNSSGLLGTSTSSRRYKHAIKDLSRDDVHRMLSLRVVDFRYLPEHDSLQEYQVGMIAEEVLELFPELIIYDKDGLPETVRYHLLIPLLVAAMQKAEHEKAELREQIARLEERIAQLDAIRTSDEYTRRYSSDVMTILMDLVMRLSARIDELEASLAR